MLFENIYNFVYCLPLFFFFWYLDKPSPPEGPINYSEFTKESVRLSWRAPEHDGNGTISGYVVERRTPKIDTWTRVTNSAPTTTHVVKDLQYQQDYVFQVSAVNQYGTSEPLEGRQVKVKLPFGKSFLSGGSRGGGQLCLSRICWDWRNSTPPSKFSTYANSTMLFLNPVLYQNASK